MNEIREFDSWAKLRKRGKPVEKDPEEQKQMKRRTETETLTTRKLEKEKQSCRDRSKPVEPAKCFALVV